MPTTVIETIAGVIKTRLSAIKTANDYSVNATVYRPKRGKVSPKDGLLVLEYQDRKKSEIQSSDHPGNGIPVAVTYDQTFKITGFRTANNDNDELDTLCDQFCSDVEVALADVDSGDWVTFGGNALEADLSEVNRGLSFESFDMFEIYLVVKYRVSEGDPYTAR
jgi:hypothetical protein